MSVRMKQTAVAASQSSPPQPFEATSNNNNEWISVQQRPTQQQESLLSKSLGRTNSLLCSAVPMKRSTSEISSITYSGYLLKRSNLPHEDSYSKLVSALPPLDTTAAVVTSVRHTTTTVLFSDDAVMTNLMSSTSHNNNNGNDHDDDDDRDGTSEEISAKNQPQHLMNQSTTTDNNDNLKTTLDETDDDDEDVTVERSSPLEQSINHIASFFGMHKKKKKEQTTTRTAAEEKDDEEEQQRQQESSSSRTTMSMPSLGVSSCRPATATPPQPIASSTTTRSAPISVASKAESSSSQQQQQRLPAMPLDDDVLRFLHRGDSAPTVIMKSSSSNSNHNKNKLSQAASVDMESVMPPPDVVDPSDGHIWRAKYCVLEDGILYFYRNATDGESQEAKAERLRSCQLYETTLSNDATIPDAAEDLSKSPTPRKLLNSYVQETVGVIYEKRVFLDRVGAVRSADHEYGECSFELLAVEDDDDDENGGGGLKSSFSSFASDKLVLRARNANEMREWLFQFHRYLATLMKNIIETVGSGGLTVPVGDIHHPSFAVTHIPPHELGLAASLYSPRGNQAGTHVCSSLFHGHGQSSALRRKRTAGKKGTPSSTPSGSPSYPGFDYSAGLKSTPFQDRDRSATSSAAKVDELPPEISRPPQTCPETERPPPRPKLSGKYVPPHLRNKQQDDNQRTRPMTGRSLSDMLLDKPEPKNVSILFDETSSSPVNHAAFEMTLDDEPTITQTRQRLPPQVGVDEPPAKNRVSPFKLGGCADPRVVVGSILDPMFKSRSASNLGQVHTDDFGDFGGGSNRDQNTSGFNIDTSLQWEIGAVSKCGVRDSNEDSYLVASNLRYGFESLPPDESGSAYLPTWAESGSHHPGLFCVFDGHNGNHAARFAAEQLPSFLVQESRVASQVNDISPRGGAETVEEVLRNAIASLDDAFCVLCTDDGRDWESGATAMVALVVHEHLVLASLGDCRGVLCRSFDESDHVALKVHDTECWSQLDDETAEHTPTAILSFFREINVVHSPSRPDERERIQEANGWVTTETEIPIGQLQRMDFCDEDVVEILKRHYSDRYSSRESSSSAPQRIMQISRVCGDLAVSRALGDHDYKAAFNVSLVEDETEDDQSEWHSPMLFLPYPNDHSRRFRGDLVSPVPELQRLKLAEKGVFDEFLLLACDGLWDVMDPDDAIRVTRGLLFEKKWEAKRAAARLAELAIHLGSSDNVTVIVVRFFKEVDERRTK